MRTRHGLLLVAVAVGGVLGGTRLLSAQEAPPVPAEAAPTAAAPAEATGVAKPTENASETEAEAEPEKDSADEKAATTPPKAVGATPGRFEPTEKVRADFDVSFPIDI